MAGEQLSPQAVSQSPLICMLNSLLFPGFSGCCCWEPPPLSECGQRWEWARALCGTQVQTRGNGWAEAHLAGGTQGQELSRWGTSGYSLSRHCFNVVCLVLRPIMVTVKP